MLVQRSQLRWVLILRIPYNQPVLKYGKYGQKNILLINSACLCERLDAARERDVAVKGRKGTLSGTCRYDVR